MDNRHSASPKGYSRPSFQTALPLYMQVSQFLRLQIEEGKLGQNGRLPTDIELARLCNVSGMVIHKAMGYLASQGLIDRKRKKGSFVRPPTEKVLIGILVGPDLMDETAYLYRNLINSIHDEIMTLKEHHWSFRVYDGLNKLRQEPDLQTSFTYQHLVNDLRNYSFRGVIKISEQLSSQLNIEINGLALPAVRFGANLQKSDVVLDFADFMRETLEFLHRQGLKKVVYLRTIESDPVYNQDIESVKSVIPKLLLSQFEIHQIQGLSRSTGSLMEEAVYYKTMELIKYWQTHKRWPEVLIIPDDIATRAVVLALVSKKIKIPEQLRIVTMANKGIVHHYGAPVIRYEIPVRVVSKTLIDILWNRMIGKALPVLPVKISGSIREPEIGEHTLGS
ncbi:MAG: GntR family transcriptional regulator [Victivallaceae bacterium]|nr:GntR family transcriptional regulator [Victivallaceae bacterium]